MKAKTPRDLALKMLNGKSHRFDFSGNYIDEVFLRNPHLDNRDRAFIIHLFYGVLRWRLRLDWIIEQASHFSIKKITPSVLNILRLALYQIFFLDRVPESAAVNEAVKQAGRNSARHVVSFVNGILRTICREKNKIAFPNRDEDLARYLSVFYSYPVWMIEKWIMEFGAEFAEGLLSAGNRIPELNIRVNMLKVSRTELIKRLEYEDITGGPAHYSPEGILLEGFSGRVDELASFRQGLFQVQDQAAQITSHLLRPEPGETLLDICAGLGGKTTHMADLMGDRGQVLALDINPGRLISLVENAGRLSIGSIIPLVADASKSLSSLFRLRFDRILVDAPCSGLGVISRHPDGKWNRNESDITRLALLQKAILSQASTILRSGGRMLYVTCTISREENEGVVNSFLDSNGDISLENIKDHVPEWGLELIDEHGFFRTFPHIHNMDGFFAALFTKIK